MANCFETVIIISLRQLLYFLLFTSVLTVPVFFKSTNEFENLRTVIVTAGVHQRFSSRLQLALNLSL